MMAARGFSVIRLKPGSKVPIVGPKEATTDPVTIQGWVLWDAAPDCNFGYLLGPKHAGLDFDLYKAGGKEARAAFGEIPPTLLVFTPGGGEHYVLEIMRQIGQQKPAPTIDVRTGNGYLVCPGSVVGGKPYLIGNDAPPALCPPHIDSQLGKRPEPYDRDAAWEGGTCGDWRSKVDESLWARIRTEGPDRSKHSFQVMSDLFALDLTDDDVVELAAEDGAFCAKYDERGDLEEEISRVRREWRALQATKLAPFSEVQTPPTTAPQGHGFQWTYEQRGRKALPWAVDDLILLRSWGLISADTGYGKTFLITRLVMCFASGQPFFGRAILAPGGTVIVAAEAAYATPHRIEAAQMHGFPGMERPPVAYCAEPPNLLTPAGQEAFISRLRQLAAEMQEQHGVPLRLVVFDTLSKSFLINEDKAAESVLAHNAMERIAVTLDVAVIAAAHVGKDESRGTRGSASHEQNAHFVLTVPKKGQLFLKKQKEAGAGIMLGRFELPIVELGRDDRGKAITSRAIEEQTGPFNEVETPDESSKGSAALHRALATASDGTIENPEQAGAPAADRETVRDRFYELYPQGDVQLNGESMRKAWNRALKATPAVKKGEADGREILYLAAGQESGT